MFKSYYISKKLHHSKVNCREPETKSFVHDSTSVLGPCSTTKNLRMRFTETQKTSSVIAIWTRSKVFSKVYVKTWYCESKQISIFIPSRFGWMCSVEGFIIFPFSSILGMWIHHKYGGVAKLVHFESTTWRWYRNYWRGIVLVLCDFALIFCVFFYYELFCDNSIWLICVKSSILYHDLDFRAHYSIWEYFLWVLY